MVTCTMTISGDQLAIAKETGRRLGMGTNMYPSASLLGQDKDASIAALPVEELIEKADGFAGVFPGGSSSHTGWSQCTGKNFFKLDKCFLSFFVLPLQSTNMKLSRSCRRGSTFVE